jgi:hypothetical protein
VRGVRRFTAEGLAEKDLLTPAERRTEPAARDGGRHVRSDPTTTLRATTAP